MQDGRLASIIDFMRYVAQRFSRDRCTAVAASLSFTSMLSAVPVITIAFALFAAFPVFEDVRGQIESLVFENFLPNTGEVVQAQLSQFTQNAERLTAVGIGALAVTAVMTLVTVETSFNLIWRAEQSRPIFQRLVLYWSIMTLGPLLMGMSVSISSILFTQRMLFLDEETTQAGFSILGAWIPFLLAMAAFFFGYKTIPSRPVAWKHALIGALVSAILFELLKNAFGFYVQNFPTYQAIYGAMATLPLFLIWTYLVWNAVLIGAEVAAALPEWHAIRTRELSSELPSSQRLVLIMRLLGVLQNGARTGTHVSEEALIEAADDLVVGMSGVLADLRKHHYITGGSDSGWLLCRDLEEVAVFQLLDELGFSVPDVEHATTTQDQVGLTKLVQSMRQQAADTASMTAKALLTAPKYPVSVTATAQNKAE